jgi:hypothetical protein
MIRDNLSGFYLVRQSPNFHVRLGLTRGQAASISDQDSIHSARNRGCPGLNLPALIGQEPTKKRFAKSLTVSFARVEWFTARISQIDANVLAQLVERLNGIAA